MDRELSGHIVVDHRDVRDGSVDAADREIGCRHGAWINRLVKVYVEDLISWPGEVTADRWVGRSHHKRRYGVTERTHELKVRHLIRGAIKCASGDVHCVGAQGHR